MAEHQGKMFSFRDVSLSSVHIAIVCRTLEVEFISILLELCRTAFHCRGFKWDLNRNDESALKALMIIEFPGNQKIFRNVTKQ